MKKKRFITHWLALALCLVVSLTASSYDYDIMVDGIAYNINRDNKSVTVTYEQYPWIGSEEDGLECPSYPYTSGSLTIPSTITHKGKNYSVTGIGDKAFFLCMDLTSVTIPNSVTSIGNQAFDGCSGLTSMTIPNSVTTINGDAFAGCARLRSVSIGNSVTTIGWHAFSGCSDLASVTIPNSVISIGGYAFSSGGLTSVTIGNSVTSIGDNAFSMCDGLTSIVVASDNTKYDSRNNCNAIIETASNTLQFGCKNTTIPNSVTSIGDWAFSFCRNLSSVTIPNSVTSIGDNAFSMCDGLTSVNIDDLAAWCKISFGYGDSNPLSCAHRLFLNGTEVKDLVIPNSVTSIGNNAFYGCSGLKSVTIPNSVTSIGNQAFSGCSGFTGSLTIPNSVTDIGSYAFEDCSGFTGSLTIPNSVTTIGWNAFAGCRGLTSVSIPNSVTSIGNNAFSGCGILELIWNAKNCLSTGGMSTTSIEKVTIGNMVETIPISFVNGSNITSVNIPNSVTTIGQSAFQNCSKLAYVRLGTGLRTINAQAFNGCPAIEDIISHRDQPAEIVDNTPFSTSIYTTATVHVPCGSLPNYYSAPVWMRFNNFVDDIVVVVKGDVNGDGRVDINDVNAVVNLILGRSTLYRDRADVTGDNRVTVADLNAVVNVMLARSVD